ncbi:MAG: CotH kinase family protein [Verrucomicrobia bacterium]|nr:CotH kinase family protein [Verrucomicrobiota bacterium]
MKTKPSRLSIARAASFRWVPLAVVLGIGGANLLVFAGVRTRDPRQDRARADALFARTPLVRLQLEIAPSNIARLDRRPRDYVPLSVREGDRVYTDVAAHLKGSAGSFRPVHGKAGFTLHFDWFEASDYFHGLRKFQLNNSVQDATYLSELVCNELFNAAGVPAPHMTHALVELNRRRLGLYVLKESIEKEFLSRHFDHPRGNVYGQPGGCDVTDPIQRTEGRGPLDYAELKALAAAAREPDPARRVKRLEQTLDVDRFLSFMAMEVMLCHWDGYTLARHNYRLYHDLSTGRVVFLPHDLDQVLGNPNLPIAPHANGLIAQAVLRTPELRARYLQRVSTLFTHLFQVPALTRRIQTRAARLSSALDPVDPRLAREVERNAHGLEQRFVNRARNLARQLGAPPPAAPGTR